MAKFSIHVNRELPDSQGRPQKFYSSKDYVSAMKKAGVEPYRGEVKRAEAPKYARSSWAEGMYQDIRNRKGAKPGDRFLKELEKRGYSQKRADEARRLAKEMR